MKKFLTFLLIVLPLCASAESFIQGIYQRLPQHQFKFDGKKIEIMELTSFYCSNCYVFQRSISVIKGNFPKKINWKTIPIHWGRGSMKPAEAYLLAEEAGMGEQMKRALFYTYFVEKKDIGDVKVLGWQYYDKPPSGLS